MSLPDRSLLGANPMPARQYRLIHHRSPTRLPCRQIRPTRPIPRRFLPPSVTIVDQ